MSGGRHDELEQLLAELRSIISAATNHAEDMALRSRGQRHAVHIDRILAGFNARYSGRVGGDTTRRISIELGSARDAVLQQAWARVLEHSKIALDALPGDPVSYPKGNLPPL